MKLSKKVEVILLFILLVSTIRMFIVDEMVGIIYFTINIILMSVISNFGTIFNEFTTKLDKFMSK